MNITSPSGSASGKSVEPALGAGQLVTLVLAWVAVGLPLAWGVAETLRKALALFQ